MSTERNKAGTDRSPSRRHVSAQSKPAEAIERFAGDHGTVVEHWDVLQVVPEASANDNGMF